MRSRCHVALALFLLVLVGNSNAKNVIPKKGALFLSGDMNLEMLTQLRGANWSNVTYIEFQSWGGDPYYALQIARLLKTKDREIIIQNYCASSCLYVMIINNNKIKMGKNAFVILHNTPSSILEMLPEDYRNIRSVYQSEADAEQAWLSENNVDLRILFIPQHLIETYCISLPSRDSALLYGRVVYKSKFLGWVPPLSIRKDFNINPSGEWVVDKDQFVKIARRRFSHSQIDKIKLGGYISQSITELVHDLDKPDIC